MQTPISFILDLILDYELPPDAQKRCRKYVRELEATLGPQVMKPVTPTAKVIHGALQAPSMQRIIEEGSPTPLASIVPAIPSPARIVGGEIQTGNGTRGPRKF